MTRKFKESERNANYLKNQARAAKGKADAATSAASASEVARGVNTNADAVTKKAAADATKAAAAAARKVVTDDNKAKRKAVSEANKAAKRLATEAKKAARKAATEANKAAKKAAAEANKAAKKKGPPLKRKENNNSTPIGKKSKNDGGDNKGGKENNQNNSPIRTTAFAAPAVNEIIIPIRPTIFVAPQKEPVSFLSLGWMCTVQFEETLTLSPISFCLLVEKKGAVSNLQQEHCVKLSRVLLHANSAPAPCCSSFAVCLLCVAPRSSGLSQGRV